MLIVTDVFHPNLIPSIKENLDLVSVLLALGRFFENRVLVSSQPSVLPSGSALTPVVESFLTDAAQNRGQ